MITVKVTYIVKPEFVKKNQENIKLFMIDFKKMNLNNFHYAAYLCEDGRTFVHISHFQNEEIQKQVLQVPSFLAFQKHRDESGLDNSHQLEVIQVVASTSDFIKNHKF